MGTATLTQGEYKQPVTLNVKRLSNLMIALAVFSGGFVIFEPAPYELILAGLLAAFFLTGMRLPLAIFPLLIAATTFSLGGCHFLVHD